MTRNTQSCCENDEYDYEPQITFDLVAHAKPEDTAKPEDAAATRFAKSVDAIDRAAIGTAGALGYRRSSQR